MKVKVELLPTKKETKTLRMRADSTVEDAIRSLKLHPEAWIPILRGSPVPLDETLQDGDALKLISAVSGG
jgi:sulfur carrier protein ThiS